MAIEFGGNKSESVAGFSRRSYAQQRWLAVGRK